MLCNFQNWKAKLKPLLRQGFIVWEIKVAFIWVYLSCKTLSVPAVNAHKDVLFKNLEEKKLQSKIAANVNLHLIDDYLFYSFFFLSNKY